MDLEGIIPILLIPFDESGRIDEESLRRVVEMELAMQPSALGVGGFASEAYKMTDAERLHCAEIVHDAVGGRVPLVIGIAPGGTNAAIMTAQTYAHLRPAALMTLPPNTMQYGEAALIDHYADFATATETMEIPVMVQQSPHLPGYAHTTISGEGLAALAKHAPNIRYFKIEGAGSAAKIAALAPFLPDGVRMFGGVGGIALKDELAAGASGLLPGVGFNAVFHRVWAAWRAGDRDSAASILAAAQPLVDAVSGRGHEFSLHARKRLLHRAGIIATPTVRRPTVPLDAEAMRALADLDRLAAASEWVLKG